MTIEIEEILKWRPDYLSEDQVGNLLMQIFKKSGHMHLVYYNPPSGSWKSVSLVKGDYEYRQVGPKRGVGKIKRPDVAMQIEGEKANRTTLFLIEAKPSRDQWDPEILGLLKAYFEGTGSVGSKPVKQIPLLHRRPRQNEKVEWEELEENDPEREWFMRYDVTYLFGFAYIMGLVNSQTDLSRELNWMDNTVEALKKPEPPLVLMAIGWNERTYAPIILSKFSATFPDSVKNDLLSIISVHSNKPDVKSSSLDEYI